MLAPPVTDRAKEACTAPSPGDGARRVLAAGLGSLALAVAAGCGGGEDNPRAKVPAAASVEELAGLERRVGRLERSIRNLRRELRRSAGNASGGARPGGTGGAAGSGTGVPAPEGGSSGAGTGSGGGSASEGGRGAGGGAPSTEAETCGPNAAPEC